MAYSKVILNGTTLIDLTDDTVDAASLLSPKVATDNSGTEVTGSIPTKTGSNLSASGKTVTVPAGYYAQQYTKDVSDANLVAGNIKKDVAIFGTTGTFTKANTVSSGQTAAGAANIQSGYSAWVDGAEVEGTLSFAQGTITNNTTLPSGSSSSGTINRGTYIKIGAGTYGADTYYRAQPNSETLQITQSGVTIVDGYASVNVPKMAIVVNVSATSNTSVTISNSNIKADHYVYNTSNTDIGSDLSWTTASGSLTLSCSSGIPAMTLLLCRDI